MPDKKRYMADTKLAVLLDDPRLQDDKYGSESSKTICIDMGRFEYHAASCFLRMLLDKYGDIRFDGAVKKYEEEGKDNEED